MEAGLVTVRLLSRGQRAATVQVGTSRKAASATKQSTAFFLCCLRFFLSSLSEFFIYYS